MRAWVRQSCCICVIEKKSLVTPKQKNIVCYCLLRVLVIAYAKVNGVICFIGDYVVPAVYDRKQLRHWYHMVSWYAYHLSIMAFADTPSFARILESL